MEAELSVLAQEILLRLPEKRSKGQRPFCAYYINGWGKMPGLFSIWGQYDPIRNLQLLLGGGVSRARLSCKEHPGNFLCLSYAAARRGSESCHGNVAGTGRVPRLHEHDKLSGQVRSRFEQKPNWLKRTEPASPTAECGFSLVTGDMCVDRCFCLVFAFPNCSNLVKRYRLTCKRKVQKGRLGIMKWLRQKGLELYI